MFTNKQGVKGSVVNYYDAAHVEVQFDSGYKTITRWNRILDGSVRDKNFHRVGKYNEIMDMTVHKNSPREMMGAKEFYDMHIRCYGKEYKKQRPTYKDVTCCDEWMYLSNYMKWRNEQPNLIYLEQQNQRFELDKDILCKGNTIYSPNTCCLVPTSVNQIFNTHSRHRGDLPIGVTWVSGRKYVIAKWQNPFTQKGEWSTTYPSTEDGIYSAFLEYKTHKEKYIQQLAEQEWQKHTITEPCYYAMKNYQVEMTD